MKFFVVALIAFAVASSWPAQVAAEGVVQVPLPKPDSAGLTTIGLGDLLRTVINQYFSSFILYITNLVLKIIPATVPVSVDKLLRTLRAIPQPTIGSVEIAHLKLVGFDARPIVDALPVGFTQIRINIEKFIAVFLAKIPQGCTFIKFIDLASILGAYIIVFVTDGLVDTFNKLDLII